MAHRGNITLQARSGTQWRRFGVSARSKGGSVATRPTVSRGAIFGAARSEGVAGAAPGRLSGAPIASATRVRSILGRSLQSVTGATPGMAGGVVLVGLNDGEGFGRMHGDRPFSGSSTDQTAALQVASGVLGVLVLTGVLFAVISARRRRTAIAESADVTATATRVAKPFEAEAQVGRGQDSGSATGL